MVWGWPNHRASHKKTRRTEDEVFIFHSTCTTLFSKDVWKFCTQKESNINIEKGGKVRLRTKFGWNEKTEYHQNVSIFLPLRINLPALKIWLNVPSISCRKHYFYGARREASTQRYCGKIWKKNFFSFSLRIIESHKSRITSLPRNIIGSYRDEESPVATTECNSINVFAQFNSTSASNLIDCRCLDFHKSFFCFYFVHSTQFFCFIFSSASNFSNISVGSSHLSRDRMKHKSLWREFAPFLTHLVNTMNCP